MSEFITNHSQHISASRIADWLAQQCEHARRTGNGWQACCPAHEDDTPSLSITATTDRVLLHCHAGCTLESVVQALGLTRADLFVHPTTNSHKPIIAMYDYYDANGTLLYQVLRYEPKDFCQRRPHPTEPGQYLYDMQSVKRVWFCLPQLLTGVAQGEVIHITEGETCALALQQLGFVATTLSGGAHAKWNVSYAEALHGAEVILYADNDAPGWNYVQRIAHGLSRVARRIRIVRFPGSPKGFDIADWLTQGHTRENLEALIADAPEWQPSGATASIWDKAIAADDFLRQEDARYEALAKDLVVPGAITVIAAPRGTFKSITTLALGIALATGGRFHGQCVQQARVLLVDRDDPPHVIRQRLSQLGATGVHNLKVLTRDLAPPLTDKAQWAAFPVQDYDVVLIDSLGAATEGISEKEGKQTQEFLATLKDLAHRGPAILALDNTNKAATSSYS